MELSTLLIILAVCLVYRAVCERKYLDWFIFVASFLCLFYYQPVSSIRNLDFWIPSISLGIGIAAWLIIADRTLIDTKNTTITYLSILAVFLLFGIVRFFPQTKIMQYISIPGQADILIFLFSCVTLIFLLKNPDRREKSLLPFVSLLLLIFMFVKNDYLSFKLSELLRKLNNQTLSLADSAEIVWVGFSYFAFRLIHVLIDSKKRGRVNVDLHVFLGYLFFFPALLAGPIMRIEDYNKELREDERTIKVDLTQAFYRIVVGIFQKFILADLLAIISISGNLAGKVSSAGWMWFLVFMYAFRIYFDFSGYTHIAIGIALLLGIKLPENFNKPLRSPTLTLFWNNWHITLTQWFRAYYFNPVTRLIRRQFKNLNPNLIMAFMQISTMVLIGLWHGISWNFTFWGLWIGVGLFIQNLFTGVFTRSSQEGSPIWQMNQIGLLSSIALTFVYISLGWVWFAMPDLSTSLQIFRTLFGMQ